jgi:hypothetical protein
MDRLARLGSLSLVVRQHKSMDATGCSRVEKRFVVEMGPVESWIAGCPRLRQVGLEG